jgi:hypothetical protein
MPPTEAQKRASKKWLEQNRETNIKRISECIQRRYTNDEDFRKKKQETERERQRRKREQKKAEEAQTAVTAIEEAPANIPIPIPTPMVYGF